MLGASRYFPDRMFAPRYWPKDGIAVATTVLDLCTTTTRSLMPVRTAVSLMPVRTTREFDNP